MNATVRVRWMGLCLAWCLLAVGQRPILGQTTVEKKPAKLRIRLPADATLEVQGQRLRGTGVERTFDSPPLEPGKSYKYRLRASWTKGGQPISIEREVPVQAGMLVQVEFSANPTPASSGNTASGNTVPPATEKPVDQTPGEDGLTAEEREIIALTNKRRAAAGAKSLTAHPLLTKAARGHSANMAQKKEMNHTLDGKQFFERIDAAGYRSAGAAENIAYGARSPQDVVDMWMNSPGHRTNLLNPAYSQIGVGVARAKDGTPYYTQVFAAPLQP